MWSPSFHSTSIFTLAREVSQSAPLLAAVQIFLLSIFSDKRGKCFLCCHSSLYFSLFQADTPPSSAFITVLCCLRRTDWQTQIHLPINQSIWVPRSHPQTWRYRHWNSYSTSCNTANSSLKWSNSDFKTATTADIVQPEAKRQPNENKTRMIWILEEHRNPHCKPSGHFK